MSKSAYKLTPAIATEACMGCGLCTNACPPTCLEMVWDFATLVRPADCTSCGECARICPHDVIHMEWQRTTGSPLVGQWREEPPAPAPPTPKRPWWDVLLGDPA